MDSREHILSTPASPSSSSPHIPYSSAYAYAPRSPYTTPHTPLSPLGRQYSPHSPASPAFDDKTPYPGPSYLPPSQANSQAHLAPSQTRRSRMADYDSILSFTRRTRQPDQPRNGSRRAWILTACLAGALGLVVLAIALGVHFGQRASSSSSPSPSDPSNTTNSSSPPPTTALITPLPRWNWTSPAQPMIGISTGNWLVLERWMAEDWFTSASSLNAWDEWTFSNITAPNTASILKQHWDTWIVEDDIDRVWKAGINMIRVPTGYWAWIPTIEGEPYAAQAGQVDQIDKLLGWAYKRQMYVLLDLHGLPGSQNGEQQSGHNTSDVRFYQTPYQTRSDATLAAALAYISSSPYRSVIAGIEVANEPRPNAEDNFEVLRGYYERSYVQCTQREDPVPMVFHHGFPAFPGFTALSYWANFTAGKDPNYLIFEDHPYPGNFPLQNNTANILYQVCQDAAGYEGYNVPVAVTEWSLTTGVNNATFEKQFYEQQLTAWSWSAGSIFWSLRANTSTLQILAAPPATQLQYSFLDLLDQGAVSTPPSNMSAQAFLGSLPQGCGAPPGERWGNWTYSSVSAPTGAFPTATVTVTGSGTATGILFPTFTATTTTT